MSPTPTVVGMPTGRRTLLLGALGVLAGCSAPATAAPEPSDAPATPSVDAAPPAPSPTASTWTFRAMTYNTLSGARGVSAFPRVRASEISFANRLPVLAEWILDARPDVLGMQENEPMAAPVLRPLRGLLPLLKGYAAVQDDCDVPILYRTSVFRAVDSGFRELSRKRLVRNGTWARLEHRATGAEVMVANTHLDPGDSDAAKRQRVVELEALVDWVAEANTDGLPLVVLGDLNTPDNRDADGRIKRMDPLYGAGLRNSADVAEAILTKVPGATTYGGVGAEVDGTWRYGAIRRTGRAIDYIWVDPAARVLGYQVYTGPKLRTVDGAAFFPGDVVPSDHCPVVADLSLPVT